MLRGGTFARTRSVGQQYIIGSSYWTWVACCANEDLIYTDEVEISKLKYVDCYETESGCSGRKTYVFREPV